MSRACAVRVPVRRYGAVAACVVLVALLVLPALPAHAAGWPSIFHAYGRFDGTTFNDPIDQPAGNAIADLSSGTATPDASGPLSSTYVAADGTDLLVRFRLKETPGSTTGAGGWDTSKGGITNNAYVVQLSVNGAHVASVGLDGKHASADYVYVAPVTPRTVNGVTYTDTNPRVVSTWNGAGIPGGRITSAQNPAAPAETFLDFRVPLSDIALVAPSVTATTPLQFFFGSSAAANLTTINKDYMSNGGTTCAIVGCASVVIGPSTLGMAWSSAPVSVSGPNPPAVGRRSVYDLTVTANNAGLNTLSSIAISDVLPTHVSPVSVSTASGTASLTNGTVSWNAANLAPGQQATMTVRVAVVPDGSWVGAPLVLTNGPAGSGLDTTTGVTSHASVGARSVGPVAGSATASDLVMTKTGPASAVAGAEVSYQLGVQNLGPAAAARPSVVDTLPAGLTYVSATGTGWSCDAVAQQVTCTGDAALAAGAAAAPIAVVAASDAALAGQRVNTATSQPLAGSDENATNDTSTAATTFTAAPPPPPSPEPTPSPTVATSESATEAVTEAPTDSATEAVTEDPTEIVTETSTEVPTEDQTETVTETPSEPETATPTEAVPETPTDDPTDEPTEAITDAPTDGPTEAITDPPTEAPTDDPTEDPTEPVVPAPIAVDDQAGGRTGEAVTVDVLANDSAPQSALDPASVTITGQMDHGTILRVDPTTGAVTYRPDVAFEGTDEFSYSVCNLFNRCDTASVSTATPPVDLAVVIVRTGAPPANGQASTYDVTVTNLGPRQAEGPLTLTLSASSQLGELSAAGPGWNTVDPASFPAVLAARAGILPTNGISLQLPAGLDVGQPSVVHLVGAVRGEAGAQIRVDAQVSGESIELVYANNESSASDRIYGAATPDPPDPLIPDEPDPRPPVDPPDGGTDDGGAGDGDISDAEDETTSTPPRSGNVSGDTPPSPSTRFHRSLAATGGLLVPLLVIGLSTPGLGGALLRAARRRQAR